MHSTDNTRFLLRSVTNNDNFAEVPDLFIKRNEIIIVFSYRQYVLCITDKVKLNLVPLLSLNFKFPFSICSRGRTITYFNRNSDEFITLCIDNIPRYFPLLLFPLFDHGVNRDDMITFFNNDPSSANDVT
ncbi:hypothetical protein D3C81_1152060 [compost metagenome]